MALRAVGEGFVGVRLLGFHQAFVQDFCAAVELGPVVTGVHGDQQGNDHTRHGGVDAAVVEQEPHDDGGNKIKADPFLSQLLHEGHEQDHHKGDEQQRKADGAAVEEGHHQDGNEVIGNGKGRKEHLERNGNLVSQDGEDAHRKGNVRGCGNAPAGG